MPGDEAILASHFLVSHLKWPNFFFLVLNPIIEDKCCKQRILNNLCLWYHLYYIEAIDCFMSCICAIRTVVLFFACMSFVFLKLNQMHPAGSQMLWNYLKLQYGWKMTRWFNERAKGQVQKHWDENLCFLLA